MSYSYKSLDSALHHAYYFARSSSLTVPEGCSPPKSSEAVYTG
jgi:hypothetical protein